MALSRLPYELFLEVCGHLSHSDVDSLCKALGKQNIYSDWIFWAYMARKDFGYPPNKFRCDNMTPKKRYRFIGKTTKNPKGHFYRLIHDNHHDIIKFLLPRLLKLDVDTCELNSYAKKAIKMNDVETIKIYLTKYKPERFVYDCINDDNVIIFRLLLSYGLNPSFDHLINACINNRERIFLLLSDRISLTDNEYHRILEISVESGLTNFVKLLLKKYKTNNNNAIIIACNNGHLDIVKILLDDGRIDPAVLDNEAIIIAARNGHYEIVKLLMNDTRVNPAARNNKALKDACRRNHRKVVNLLLTHEKVIDIIGL